MFIESVMPSNHVILCRPFLLPLSIFPSHRVFSSELVLHIKWPKYWSFSFSISPSNGYSGLISFRMDWLYLLAVHGTVKSLLQHHSSKISVLQCSAFFIVQLSHPYMTTGNVWLIATLWDLKGVTFPFPSAAWHLQTLLGFWWMTVDYPILNQWWHWPGQLGCPPGLLMLLTRLGDITLTQTHHRTAGHCSPEAGTADTQQRHLEDVIPKYAPRVYSGPHPVLRHTTEKSNHCQWISSTPSFCFPNMGQNQLSISWLLTEFP